MTRNKSGARVLVMLVMLVMHVVHARFLVPTVKGLRRPGTQLFGVLLHRSGLCGVRVCRYPCAVGGDDSEHGATGGQSDNSGNQRFLHEQTPA